MELGTMATETSLKAFADRYADAFEASSVEYVHRDEGTDYVNIKRGYGGPLPGDIWHAVESFIEEEAKVERPREYFGIELIGPNTCRVTFGTTQTLLD